jgi:general secretion pathway protein E
MAAVIPMTAAKIDNRRVTGQLRGRYHGPTSGGLCGVDSLLRTLHEQELLNGSDLARAEQVRARTGGRLAETLVRLGLVAEDDIARAFRNTTGLDRIGRTDLQADGELLATFNPRFLSRHAVVPLGTGEDGLAVAMADPEDTQAIEALRFASGRTVLPRIATFSDVQDVLGNAAIDHGDLGGIAADYGSGAEDDIDRLLEDSSDAPVIRLVQSLLAGAVSRGASDVHIEPMARHLMIRYRIDGRLIEAERYPDAFAGPVASRIKIMSSLDIAESRLPQDGRLRLTVRGREVDVRVSTSPTAWGESIVLRLLGRTTVPLDLDRLGLPDGALAALGRALRQPHGIILLTGPTGSGKTTTLYAAISRLRRPEVKILTVEDPVEVLLDGINQVQVRPDIGLGYPETLRAFLRQDPDILMIGEIRDRETADIAMRAALTGHLVLSTLHTNSALGAFTRLSDIGIEPYLTASTVIATIAQRLIRALCTECRAPRSANEAERLIFAAANMAVPDELFDPVGCSACHHSGYAGRIPLIEVVEVDEALRGLIRAGNAETLASGRDPRETLHGHGLSLVVRGVTTIAEVERAVQAG